MHTKETPRYCSTAITTPLKKGWEKNTTNSWNTKNSLKKNVWQKACFKIQHRKGSSHIGSSIALITSYHPHASLGFSFSQWPPIKVSIISISFHRDHSSVIQTSLQSPIALSKCQLAQNISEHIFSSADYSNTFLNSNQNQSLSSLSAIGTAT